MFFGAVGDLHGDFDALDRIMARHPEIGVWLCPGDLADDAGGYRAAHAALYWIKGNNENFDFVELQPPASGTLPNLHYLPNGIPVDASGLMLAGLGGTFAPTWYETPAADLPSWRGKSGREAARGAGVPANGATRAGRGAPVPRLASLARDALSKGQRPASKGATKRDDKRRHFVHEEVEACKRLRGIDVFLSHEAARPFLLEQRRGPGTARHIDAGKTPINEVLAAMQPRLHLFGHHHRYTVTERQAVPSIGLDMIAESYLVVDGRTMAYQRLKT